MNEENIQNIYDELKVMIQKYTSINTDNKIEYKDNVELDIEERIERLEGIFDLKDEQKKVIENKYEKEKEIIEGIERFYKRMNEVRQNTLKQLNDCSKEYNNLIEERIKLEKIKCDKETEKDPKQKEANNSKYESAEKEWREKRIKEFKDNYVDIFEQNEELKKENEKQMGIITNLEETKRKQEEKKNKKERDQNLLLKHLEEHLTNFKPKTYSLNDLIKKGFIVYTIIPRSMRSMTKLNIIPTKMDTFTIEIIIQGLEKKLEVIILTHLLNLKNEGITNYETNESYLTFNVDLAITLLDQIMFKSKK